MRSLGPLGLVALLSASCSRSLESEALNLRAEIAALQKSVPPESPLWISEGPDRFDRFMEDYSPRIPEHIYLHVVRKLNAMKTPEAEDLSQGDFDFAACEKDPDRFRGRTWRIHGLIGEFHPEDLRGKDFPVRVVHAGVLFDDERRPILFHVVQKPEVLTIREDHVETKAIFFKMIEYTSRSGRRVVAPFFVGKVLRRFV